MLRQHVVPHAAHARLLWRVAPRWASLSLACTLVGSAFLVVSMLAVGRLIGAVYRAVIQHGDTAAVWGWFAVFAAVTVLDQWRQAVARWSDPRVWAGYRVQLNDLIAETGLHPRGLAELDS